MANIQIWDGKTSINGISAEQILANRQDLDYFISIHVNAGKGKGVEVYTYEGRQFTDALEDLGLVRLQYSVFYGDLNSAESRSLARTANELLDPKEDKCFWYPCRLDIEKVKQCVGYKNFQYSEPDCHGRI